MLKQAKITINLLRTSRKKPKFPAYAKIFGQLDFNAMPMAPPVTKIIAHEKPTQHETWIKMEYRDGTLFRHWNTIYVTKYL